MTIKFVDFIDNNYDYFLLLDLENNTFEKIEKKEFQFVNADKLYCYDLYKFYDFFDDFFPQQLLDIQSLYGLMLQKTDSIEELFDSDSDIEYFKDKQRINNHFKTYSLTRIDYSKFPVDKLVPNFLFESCIKNKILAIKKLLKEPIEESVLDYFQTNYSCIKSVIKLSKKPIFTSDKTNPKITLRYNIFGAKNSRMTIKHGYFNLYNIAKEKRDYIIAPPDFEIFQFDFKAFQPRIALSVFGDDNLKKELNDTKDIYSLFEGDREENKIELISWMFSNRINKKFDEKLSCIKETKESLHKQNQIIKNYFGRPLFFTDEESNVKFQHIVCSLEADIIFQLINSFEIELTDSKSYLAFPFYDALYFMIHDSEKHLKYRIQEIMESFLLKKTNTALPVSVSSGKNLFELQKED
jgi:hypothetical protein